MRTIIKNLPVSSIVIAAGLIFNLVNLVLIGTLVARRGGWFGARLAYG